MCGSPRRIGTSTEMKWTLKYVQPKIADRKVEIAVHLDLSYPIPNGQRRALVKSIAVFSPHAM